MAGVLVVFLCVLECTTLLLLLLNRGTPISINRSNRCIMEPSAEVISSCLNLMRRLPPKDIEKSLAGLLNLVPEATDELLQRVDQVCPAIYNTRNSTSLLLNTRAELAVYALHFFDRRSVCLAPVLGDSFV